MQNNGNKNIHKARGTLIYYKHWLQNELQKIIMLKFENQISFGIDAQSIHIPLWLDENAQSNEIEFGIATYITMRHH